MDEYVIRVEHISKDYKLYDKKSDRLREAVSLSKKQYYKPFHALTDISFDVKKGETIGIIGTNGSGKSTLLKILTGVVAQSGGTFSVSGKISALLELGAGFNAEYTGLQNIELHGTMMGYTAEEMETRREEIIRFADIGDYINQPVKNYSSGMFARLAFAVAISIDPEILIVDEALSVGDVRFQIKCMDRMRRMMEGGTTILMVSHDINAIRRFCTKCLWLHQGRMMAYGDTNAIADRYVDYLKCLDAEDAQPGASYGEPAQDDEIAPFDPSGAGDKVASIVKFEVLNYLGHSADSFQYSEPVTVSVVYDVFDESMQGPVLGVALFSIADEYICGLNTLLDHVEIPWKYGRNKFSMQYQDGLRVLGGKYYFDVAVRDSTATVDVDYIRHIKEITVSSDYVAEGKLVIPHRWGR